MRGMGLVVLLVAGAVSACNGRPLRQDPDPHGPSVIVRHVVETDVEAPEAPTDVRAPGGKVAGVKSTTEPPVGRTSRRGSVRSGTAPGSFAAEAGPDGASATAWLPPGRVPDTRSIEPATATPREEAQLGAVVTAPTSPTPATIEPIENEGARFRTSTSPWPWALLAVLLVVVAVAVVRRLRARSRPRSHRFDPDDAWAVFQAGLARRPGDP